MTPPEALHTARLVLRKPTGEDAPLMFAAYGQDREVSHYLTWRPHENVSDSQAVIEYFLNCWAGGSEFHWLLFRHGSSELAGAIGLRREAHRFELGYVLARPHWGQELLVEATMRVAECAFADPAVFRLSAVCDIDNQRSARVLEKAGFQREGVLRKWALHPNISDIPRDCYSYSQVCNI
jgi:RimJ/RimL family protein N-acetyltransferase